MTVPAPVCAKAPVPAITPATVSVVLAAAARDPVPVTVMSRLVENTAVVASVPPARVKAPLASPRRLSALILTVPALMVVPPV